MTFVRRHAARLSALLIVLVLYGFTRLPHLTPQARQALVERFHFTQLPLPKLTGYPRHSVRPVNPSLAHIDAWISAVGAAVALNDLDGDGLPNDLCLVDPRIDQIMVAPVPGTGARYTPFALQSAPLPFDPATMAPMGCLPGDLNEDGRMDLVVYYWGRTPIAFVRQDRGYRPVEIVTPIERWNSNAATLADLDGDGHLDLVVGNYFPDGARVLDANATAPVFMQHSMSRAYNGGGTHLLVWASDGNQLRFREVSGVWADRLSHGWTLAVGAADLDGDLRPELYIANDFGPDRLLHNRSTAGHLDFALLKEARGFATPASKALGNDSFKGMGVDFGDLNGDGLQDIVVSNIAAEYALEESHFAFLSTGEVRRMAQGVAPYVDRSEALGLSRSDWAWDIKLDDFDNDGNLEVIQATGFVKGRVDRWPQLQEIAMGNDELLPFPAAWHHFTGGDDLSGHVPNAFFARGPDGRYVDIAGEIGLGQPDVSRGIAIADVDADGDLDFVVANQWEPSYFYRNDCSICGRSLSLSLRLPAAGSTPESLNVRPGDPVRPSRPAVGASASVTLPDGRVLVRQVDGGNGHSGKRSPDLHFGLGEIQATTELAVKLRWRDAAGHIRSHGLRLRPGRYTVYLGQQGNKEVSP